jgi:acyl carrier protein
MSDSVNSPTPHDTRTPSTSSDDIEQRVLACVAATMHFEPSRVTRQATFEELGLDSLDGINVLFALENEFDINIPNEEVQQVRNVRQMCTGVAKLVAAKAPAAEE